MRLPTIYVNGRSYKPLFPDLFRPLTGQEREELKKSISDHGVKNPVQAWVERDGAEERHWVIDGWNRLTIHAEVFRHDPGVSIDIEHNEGLTREECRDLAISLNLSKGRQLDPEQRQRLAVELRQQGLSYRQIGERLGVSKDTAQRDAAGVADETPDHPDEGLVEPAAEAPPSAEATAPEVTPDAARSPTEPATEPQWVRGRDGKKYPATKAKKAKKSAPALRLVPAPTPEADPGDGADGAGADVAPAARTEPAPDPDTDPEARVSRGQGVALAHDAINCLRQIPVNDGLCLRGYEIVADWIASQNGPPAAYVPQVQSPDSSFLDEPLSSWFDRATPWQLLTLLRAVVRHQRDAYRAQLTLSGQINRAPRKDKKELRKEYRRLGAVCKKTQLDITTILDSLAEADAEAAPPAREPAEPPPDLGLFADCADPEAHPAVG